MSFIEFELRQKGRTRRCKRPTYAFINVNAINGVFPTELLTEVWDGEYDLNVPLTYVEYNSPRGTERLICVGSYTHIVDQIRSAQERASCQPPDAVTYDVRRIEVKG